MRAREFIRENIDQSKVQDFINWSIKTLNIQQPYPKFNLSQDTEDAQNNHHTGANNPSDNTIWVYVKNRNLVDIFRTIFHELVHTRQAQLNMIKPGASYPGSPIEAMADMMAGKYIKIYGEQHHEIFESVGLSPIIIKRNMYGKGTMPVATLEINPHTVERQTREGYRPIRDEEVEKVLQKIVRNRELIMNTIAPGQVCQVYDPQMNIGMLLQHRSPPRRGLPPQIVALTITPGRMWGKDDREEVELR
jgi:hypothetical protein